MVAQWHSTRTIMTIYSDAYGSFRGLDIHVAADGNFLQRHCAAAGECPDIPYALAFFLSPEQVAAAEAILEAARSRPARKYEGVVPDVAIDGCEEAHTAGDDSKEKTASARFDDKGLMALVCRHDIPLAVANITSPGEGQKYVLALLTWLFEEIPPDATVAALYDIGCVADRTRQIVSLYFCRMKSPDMSLVRCTTGWGVAPPCVCNIGHARICASVVVPD